MYIFPISIVNLIRGVNIIVLLSHKITEVGLFQPDPALDSEKSRRLDFSRRITALHFHKVEMLL